jgi:cytochrome c oxidase assembly protein subunit 15
MAEIAIARTAGTADQRVVAAWLLVVCAFVFAMVVLGGVTRLTGSGLSIVDWRPITGILPPLDQNAWAEAFARYRQFPEYQKVNPGMTLSGFKSIFWLEFSHRLLGRLLGFVFVLPFLWFLVTRRIERAHVGKFVLMFVLGGAQGLLGWYMVKSGLVDRPDVSHLRLTAHLGLAVAIYGYIFWVALDLLYPPGAPIHVHRSARGLVAGLRGLVPWVFLVILSGGLVAGLDAGFSYNTFPLMDGDLVPAGLLSLTPWPANLVGNAIAVQFDHRVLAVVTGIGVAGLWLWSQRVRLPARLALALHGLLAAVVLQLGLGILTLLLVVPIPLAAAHQAGALVLFSAAVVAAHAARRLRPVSL